MARNHDDDSGAVTELARARAALASGAEHVSREARSQDRSLARTRMLGNQLRELDRLLSICLDALQATLDVGSSGDPAFTRLRNTPNKLCRIETRLGSRTGAHLRLRAIGRIGACLHHCSGRIYDGRIHDDVALVHGTGARRSEQDNPNQLYLSAETLTGIGHFYLEILRTLAESRQSQPL